MLKSLELAGFKSFADKTRLDFPSGVTVIVGPNGSGKSNVVDAIKWVLGSQSPKSMRGKEMTDVIFSGSASRGALNTAEVTLAFDNPEIDTAGRRFFDLNEPEVRFTRRVYRSGEGEYLINGHASRLRDFRELLAGTGFGADTYSIIEQGRVDAALQASPTDRRALFEEAAGISRYRLKKREADKRLERVEQNLLRLSDIVDEVESRLRRVRSQAGKAKQYREQTDRLREVRTQLGLADRLALLTEKRRLDDQQRLLGERLAEARKQVALQEASLESSEQSESQVALRKAEEGLAGAREQIARETTTCQMERARYAELQAEEDAARQRLVDASKQSQVSEATGEEQAIVAAERAATACRTDLHKATESVARLSEGLEVLANRLTEAQAEQSRAQDKSAGADAECQRLEERVRAIEHSLKELHVEATKTTSGTEQTRTRLGELHTEQQEAQQLLEQRTVQHAEDQTQLAEGQAAVDAERQRLAQGQGELLAMRHRLDVLAAEEQRLAALNRDIRALLSETDLPTGETPPTVFGLVADLLHVDVDLAGMVEAALGGRTNHVVVDSGALLINALQGRTGELTTRAGFEHLDSLNSIAAIDRVDLTGESGVMGRANDYVESEARFEPLLRRLLGRTWFVDTLDTAVHLARTSGRGLTFVTHEGEVVGADGAIIVGPHEDSEGVLTRRRKAGSLRATVETAQQRVEQIEENLREHHQQNSTLQEKIASQTRDLTTQQSRLHTLQRECATLEERLRQAESSETVRSQSVREKTDGLARLSSSRHALNAKSETTRSQAVELSERVEGLRAELVATERALAAERARETELRAASSRHDALLASLHREKSSMPFGEAVEESLAKLTLALDGVTARRSTSEQTILDATSRLAEATVELQAWNQRKEQAAEREGHDRAQQREATEILRTNRSEAEQLLGLVAQVELRRQQIATELRTLDERMHDHGIDLAEHPVQSEAMTEAEACGREALRREVDTLRRQVDGVGSVNLESLEELDDLEGRFEQLSTQYNDLSQAKASLLRLTSRINADSRELYLASFEVVRQHFRELFQRMFGGGEADLVMVGDETDDPLERGVEIVASPPGKELSNLSLLSGGEKTMTCVTLLLALFRSKPSPFCVLDEVDAALDEANIGRFTAVLSEFLTSTQFLVITHSKRTMVGADTLFGVTMQESGISKQVSVRFEDVSEEGHIRPAALSRAVETPPLRRAA